MHRFLSVCLSVCLSVTGQKLLDINYKNYWTIIHISKSIAPRFMKFGQGMDVDDAWVDLEGQGRRSKVKVTKLKNVISALIKYFMVFEDMLSRSRSRSRVTWCEVNG